MINIYTSYAELPSGKSFILSNDDYFSAYISPKSITEQDKQYMRLIDQVTEVRDDYIKTPFGGATLYNISTGCKTIINIAHLLNQGMLDNTSDYPIFNISECGANALEEIFSLIDDTPVKVLLTHGHLPGILSPVKNCNCIYTFNILGKSQRNNSIPLIATGYSELAAYIY